uniref:Uncharacterized protein n=1 Tax=Catagonus wagneri TaxID=51154 RepID=A0A8C3WS32_9CETA
IEIQTNFPVKMKVRKIRIRDGPDQEQLVALLQCLLEKSYVDREHLDKEAWKDPLGHPQPGFLHHCGH